MGDAPEIKNGLFQNIIIAISDSIRKVKDKKQQKIDKELFIEKSLRASNWNSRKVQTAFAPVCPNCDEGRMFEAMYSHDRHQELYWCPKCGTLNIEVDGEDAWLRPTHSTRRSRQAKVAEIQNTSTGISD
jgi:predicted RNA-binding Zn-ribbon protein involved in translation (DUF1610 family)